MDFLSRDKVDDIIRKKAAEGEMEIFVGSRKATSLAVRIGYFVCGVIFVFAVWWIVAEWYNTTRAVHLFFPMPMECLERLYSFFANGFSVLGTDIVVHIKYSLIRWIEGFLIALLIGSIIGVVLSLDDRMYKFGMIPVNILQMIPGLAWYPVCILLFGLGNTTALFIIAITVVSPIAINVCTGLRRVPKVNMRVADMCGKTHYQKFVQILLPFAAMDFISGIRIGMANAWRMLISAEMVVGVAVGLGYAIQIETAYLDYTSAFACIIIICCIGLIIDKLFIANIESYMSSKLGVGK